MKYDFDEIVITGVGALTAAGNGVAAVAGLLDSGTDAFSAIPHDVLMADGFRWGKFDSFKASDYMSPMKARKMDRCSQFAVAVAGMALKEAGIDLNESDRDRIGIALGSGYCGVTASADFLSGYFGGGVEGLLPMVFPNTVPNAPASNASIEYGFRGANVTHVQRYCSAESALLMACRFIQEGRADVMLAGGTDELSPVLVKGLAAIGQLRRTSAPVGEGCGIVVLESAGHARRRRARVLASITGISTIGRLLAGRESEGVALLVGDSCGCGMISLSGTAADITRLTAALPQAPIIETGCVVGRSLAMGGIAMAALAAMIPVGTEALHLAASPEGPCFAVRFKGVDTV